MIKYKLEPLRRPTTDYISSSSVLCARVGGTNTENMSRGLYDRSKKRKHDSNSCLTQRYYPYHEMAINDLIMSTARIQEPSSIRFTLGPNNVKEYVTKGTFSQPLIEGGDHKKIKLVEGDRDHLTCLYDEDEEEESRVGTERSYLHRDSNVVNFPSLPSARVDCLDLKHIQPAKSILQLKTEQPKFPSYSKKWEDLKTKVSRNYPTLSSDLVHNIVRNMFMDSLNSGNVTILETDTGWSKDFNISGKREGSM